MAESVDVPQHLDRAVDEACDHILGSRNADITLVEYGSYDCPHSRVANARIAEVRNRFGDRVRYVYRHASVASGERARRAAEIVEQIDDPGKFWRAHVALMTRSAELTEEDLEAVSLEFCGDHSDTATVERARKRVAEDTRSARASGVRLTPTFFINGWRYDGPWDESSFADAMLGTFGHRVRVAALTFASWAPSAGVLLLLATIAAIVLANSPIGERFTAFWATDFALAFGAAELRMSLLEWINDALLSVFFLVVGLEIKRELTVGHLASRRSAALPIAAAVGGLAVPALIYAAIVPSGDWSHGWGVPISTDTAFAIALLAILGQRVPIELRIFLTAAAIADDIGAIIVVALFYSGDLDFAALGGAAVVVALLVFLNRSGVYRAVPYLLLGVALWACVHAGGLHATLAGVLLAAAIPTRPPPDYRGLLAQAEALLAAEVEHRGEQLRHGPSVPTLQTLDAIHDRLESPADRMLRSGGLRSSYLVLPIFALANSGVALEAGIFEGRELLMLGIAAGLVVGKPLGFIAVSLLAVRLGIAQKPEAYSWRQLAGAGALAGIGFTMSLFIAGESLSSPDDFAAAKIAIFGASVISAALGVLILAPAARGDRRIAADEDHA